MPIALLPTVVLAKMRCVELGWFKKQVVEMDMMDNDEMVPATRRNSSLRVSPEWVLMGVEMA